MGLILVAQVEPGSVGGHLERQQEIKALFGGGDMALEGYFSHVPSFVRVDG